MPRIKELKRNYIGKTVRKWLIDADMTQQDLANAIGISPQLLGYKINNNAFAYGDLIDVIEALDVPDDEIVKAMRK